MRRRRYFHNVFPARWVTKILDDESVPTIQCSTCYEWHHRPCVASSNFMECFTCPDCGSAISEESPESEVASVVDLPKLLPNPTPKKSYSNPNTSTHFSTPPSELRRPQTSPRSPLTSVRNIVALWKERTSAGAAKSVSSVSPSAGIDDLQGIRRRVEDTRSLITRSSETQAVSNPLATSTTPVDSPRNSTLPPAPDISELYWYSHSNDPVSCFIFIQYNRVLIQIYSCSLDISEFCGISMFMHHLIDGKDATPSSTLTCFCCLG